MLWKLIELWEAKIRKFVNVVGILMTALGVLWILQGMSVIQGGFMAGQTQYALLGAVLVVVGLGLVAFVNRRGRGVAGPGSR